MSISLSLFAARAEFYRHAENPDQRGDFLRYIRAHSISQDNTLGFAGACAVVPVIDCGNGRFDFHENHEDSLKAFVCEAFGSDGETTVDLVAWPIDRPKHVMSMFGRCGLLGLWDAMGTANYVFNYPLQMHRTPLDWIKSDFRGAAIVTPHIAARTLLDIPGRIAAQDHIQGRELKALIESVVPKDRIVVPAMNRRAA